MLLCLYWAEKKDAKYAIMTFLGVNYDFICKL